MLRSFRYSCSLRVLLFTILFSFPALAQTDEGSDGPEFATERGIDTDGPLAMPLRGGGPGGGGDVDLEPQIEWDKRAEIGERLSPLGLELLGDSIDPHTGSISFRHTDISLPGNSGLRVELTRELTQGYFHAFSVDAEFGDWNYVVPRLHIVTAEQSSQQTDHWIGARCTDPEAAFTPVYYVGTSGLQNLVYPVEYTNGLLLDVPGHGSQQVLAKSPTVTLPFPSEAQYVTAQNWYLTCGSAGDGGEGFVAVAPNGDRYRFDRYIQYTHRNLGSITPDGGNAGPSRIVPRVRAMLMATEVTDVHGNWVRYSYDGAGRLTQIYANDGRAITLGYNGADKVVSTVTANGRTWSYGYVTEDVSDYYVGDYGFDKKILSSVTRPDGLSWSFDLLNMHQRALFGTRCVNGGGTMSLTHPHGATGTYTIAETLHRKGYAEWMVETTLRCSGAFVNLRDPTYYDIYHEPLEVMSVTQKTLSGPHIPTSQWTYSYESDVDEERYPVGHQYEGHPIATSGDDPTNWTKVLNPDGTETTYYHFWNTLSVSGYDTLFAAKLDRQELRATAGGTILQTVGYDYIQTGAFGGTYVPNSYPYPPFVSVIYPKHTGTPVRVASSVISQDGDTFTTEHSYEIDQDLATYSYGYPIQTRVHSNVSTNPRITDITYEHNASQWVIGLTKTVTVNSRPIDLYNYYPTTGALYEHWRYGIRVAEYDRYATGSAAGQISAVTDALNRTTELLDWKRGTPQHIKRADNSSVYQYVDGNGWMTSAVDARGNAYVYGRDNMGRLTLVDPPGAWTNTSIGYDFFGGGAVQTITKGQGKTTVSYDELLRPILERMQALDTGWSSYVNTSYDVMGRLAFKSQPSISSTETAGMSFVYDSLGRISTETETVSPFAEVRHEYLASHLHRVYDPVASSDPSGSYMDYFSYGYDGPGNDNYRAMYHSSDQNTDIYQNVWGETEQVRQWGTQNGVTTDHSHFYYYDNERRVCRHYVPEHGATKYDYDDAGQMVAYAKGQPDGSCIVPTGNARVSLDYDLLGRLKTTDFTDAATPDIARTYDLDGNPETVNRAGVNWTYVHNELNMLESESLAIDGLSFDLAYLYNLDGHLKQTTLPSGRVIDYTPDGLGRLTLVKDGTATLASGIGYHPSGAVSAMTYGNSQVFSQTLNARLLPQRLLSSYGSEVAIDQTFGYDVRGNVTSITDGAVSGNSRVYGYDTLDRIDTATGPWGAGNYDFDALGNLRLKTLGSRSVTPTYDSLNRLSQSVDTGASGTRAVTYDTRGNVTGLGGLTFYYDYSDQPVSLSGTASGTYQYDGNLKRVKAVVNGKTIYYIYDASGSLVYIHSTSDDTPPVIEETDYVAGPSGKFARITNNDVTYLHADILGSAQSGTDSLGNIAWREQYTPFGEELQSPAANDDQAAFTGHIRDSATGLNYMQARYYDPIIGRFLSVDPVGFSPGRPDMFGRFTYVSNNPMRYSDPTGRNRCNGNCGGFRGVDSPEAKALRIKMLAAAALIAVPDPSDLAIGAIAAKAATSKKGLDIVLKMKEGWSDSQKAEAAQKVDYLNDLAEKGELSVVKNPQRSSTSASRRYKQAGNEVEAGQDVDHMKDLQLSGDDTIDNMGPLDSSVNRSLGSQIHQQIKDADAGTMVCNVALVEC